MRKKTSSQETPGFGIGDKSEERKTYEWSPNQSGTLYTVSNDEKKVSMTGLFL